MSTSTETVEDRTKDQCVCGHLRGAHVRPVLKLVLDNYTEGAPLKPVEFMAGCGHLGCECNTFDSGDQTGRIHELPQDILTREDTMRTEGHKDDFGKTSWASAPWPAMAEMAEVMTFGAKKYERYNYRKGMKWSRLFSAAVRHLYAWWRGEENDEESGISHLAHAACCILMMRDLQILGRDEDDRDSTIG